MNIGKLQFEKPICLAPMEDVTNVSFRLVCKQMGADIVYTEFASSEALIRDIPRVMSKIKVNDEERPVGIQIFGGNEDAMEKAAAVAEECQPDFIDINCGCWVRNHVARGEGAALLKDLPKFKRIVKATIKGTSLPVTVKTRLGWDQDSIVILDTAQMLEDAGVEALTVHCRTRSQAHEGRADWSWLEKLKKKVRMPIIGNGDLMTPENVKEMFETGCDGVMIGRAAIGNPWIFKKIKHYLETGSHLPEPSLEERIGVCIDHLKLSVSEKGLKDGTIRFRKYYAGYLKGIPHVSKLRFDLMQLIDCDAVINRLKKYLDEVQSYSLTC